MVNFYTTSNYRLNSRIGFLLFLVLLAFANPGIAQELEPRGLTNLPVGTNFVALGYSYTQGEILLDPAVPIEDLNANLHVMVGAYVRAINFFGLSSKIDVIVPYAIGDWTGLYLGADSATSRSGFGDIRVRLSVNMLGAPALNGSQFLTYEQKTIFGLSFQIILPTGQYFQDKLINLGSNRMTFKPQLGISHKTGRWILEGYGSLWIFTRNKNFYGGNQLDQHVLATLKIHVIRSLPKGMWLAGSLGYGIGGRTEINEEERDTRISALRLGVTYAIPFKKHHALKFNFHSGIRFERGPDFDAFSILYQYRWGAFKNKS
ncbi:MAG: transporter [Bacteroidales bacterium]|nr:transporter [Bacteroidales bacterium]